MLVSCLTLLDSQGSSAYYATSLVPAYAVLLVGQRGHSGQRGGRIGGGAQAQPRKQEDTIVGLCQDSLPDLQHYPHED